MNHTKFVAAVVFALIACVSAIAQADSPGPQITGVTVTSSVDPADPLNYGLLKHLVDDSGMIGDVQERGAPAIAEFAFRLHAFLHFPNEPALLTFDLGSVQAVDNMQIWNYLEFNNTFGTTQGLRDFELLYSTDDITYTSLGFMEALQNDGEAPFPFGATDQHDHFAIGADARYVRIGIPVGDADLLFPESNWGSDFVGLGEVRFYAPSAALPGDFDGNGNVDGNDFLLWQRGGSPIPLSQSDLADWEANYGVVTPLSATSTAVPEPATGIMLMLGMAVMVLRRDHQLRSDGRASAQRLCEGTLQCINWKRNVVGSKVYLS